MLEMHKRAGCAPCDVWSAVSYRVQYTGDDGPGPVLEWRHPLGCVSTASADAVA